MRYPGMMASFLVGAAAMTLAAPGIARGASVVYTDANNVWAASPDGSVKRQITTNGTAEVYWTAASQADSGMILAFLRAGSNSTMTYMNPDGSVIRSGLTPTAPIGSTCDASVTGPSHSRINPAGTLSVYDVLCNRTVYTSTGLVFDISPYSIVSSTGTVSPVGSLFLEGWSPTFVPNSTGAGETGERVLVADPRLTSSSIFQYKLVAPLSYTAVINPDPGGNVHSADVSRDGRRVAVDETPGGASASSLFIYGQAVPLGDPASGWTSGCLAPTGPNPDRPSLSPDGSMLAWSDDGGAKVATITSIAGSASAPPPCVLGSTTVLSATGRTPVFSNAAVAGGSAAAAAAAGGSATPAARLSITAPRSVSRRAIRSKGIAVSTRCPAACTVRATMKAGTRVLARGSKRLKRAGVAKIILRAKVPPKAKSVTVTITRGGLSGSKVVRVTG